MKQNEVVVGERVVVHMGVRISAYRVVVISMKEGDHLCRHRGEDSIKMDLKEVEWEVVDWIHLA
jgi:hypothetical protein